MMTESADEDAIAQPNDLTIKTVFEKAKGASARGNKQAAARGRGRAKKADDKEEVQQNPENSSPKTTPVSVKVSKVKIPEETLVRANLQSQEKSAVATVGRSSRVSRKLDIRKSSLADFTPASRVKVAATKICDEEGNLPISCRGGKVVGESCETESTQERVEEGPPLKAGRKTRKVVGESCETESTQERVEEAPPLKAG